MTTNLSNQRHTEDQLKQVEFLRATLGRYSDNQKDHYKDLNTKITFLFGFVVTVLTFYGTYATIVSPILKCLTMLTLGAAVVLLCIAFWNRTYFNPPQLDTSVDSSNYFSKVYQDVANLKKAYIENKTPLQDLEVWVGRAILVFTIGIVFLILSFLLSQTMVKSTYEQLHSAASSQRATTTRS